MSGRWWPLLLGLGVMALLGSWFLTYWGLAQPPNATDHHPAVEHQEVAGKRVVYREVLAPPYSAPDFELTDQRGSLVKLSDFRGRLVLLSFIYTSCPDVCPLLTSNYLAIQRAFPELVGDRLILIFITTDPSRDDPKRLLEYTKAYGGRWLFLTGEPSSMERVWEAYDVFVQPKEEPSGILVYHSYKTYLIDGEGRVRYIYIGIYDAASIISDIRALLKEGG